MIKMLKSLAVGDKVIFGTSVGTISRVLWCMDDTWISAHVEVDGTHDGALQGHPECIVDTVDELL
jgi:preprotein translocase subunit YajC